MKTLISMVVGAWCLLAGSVVWAQTEHMMEGGRHTGWFGGYGFWGAVLLGVLLAAVIFLLMDRRKK
ncbi:hypothetical protein [Wenzhouxiangella sp. XN24]|uniref:hypothetical protein n=1 Tax=Wenzhouxiangella sp. XN24 TaxID=2713569 RepID=UPI0013E9BF7F|nr:hypothetical protein [Wenzhouxiangella sp. XN24]NGX15999.1 hypothetical protein [Wenzhouxiangella sp. XN24]